MTVLDWHHNGYYQPTRCRRVLDISCGTGLFASRLPGRVEHVDAIDRSPVMLEIPGRHSPDNVTCVLVAAGRQETKGD